jgi:hypothetical protein
MLGLEMFGNDADETDVSTTGAFLGNSNEKDVQSVKPRQTNNVEYHEVLDRHDETLSTTVEEKYAEDTAATGQGGNEIKETLLSVPTNCLFPFAHLFSRKCREVLAKRPLYDMDAFLDSMI